MSALTSAAQGDQPARVHRAVYYAVDSNPSILAELRRSIESIRRFNSSIPIYIVAAGPTEVPRSLVEDFGVRQRRVQSPLSTGGKFFHKWRALALHFPEDQLLYLDADTVANDDIDRLFDETGAADFHARLDPACPRVLNEGAPASLLDQELYDRICASVETSVLPIFNAGVMLFKNGLHHKVGALASEIEALRTQFVSKALPYPCQNVRLLDEVVGSLILGRISGLTWAEFCPSLSPFFVEVQHQMVGGPGVLMHVWSPWYPKFLQNEEGPDAESQYRASRSRGTWQDRCFGFWVQLGVFQARLPRLLLHRWICN